MPTVPARFIEPMLSQQTAKLPEGHNGSFPSSADKPGLAR